LSIILRNNLTFSLIFKKLSNNDIKA